MSGNEYIRMHPRPDFRREMWLELNGEWDFSFDDADTGMADHWFIEQNFERKINVPFCYQSESSGIHDTAIHPLVWYSRIFELPQDWCGKRVILHFGAVDYSARVWINGMMVGTHTGGHTSFWFDISDYIGEGVNTIIVRVEDRASIGQPRGKQYWLEQPDRCFYTATTGIWQSVWIEAVGCMFIEKVMITPDIDQRRAIIELEQSTYKQAELKCEVSYNGEISHSVICKMAGKKFCVQLPVPEIDGAEEKHYWSPENPNLYDVTLSLSSGNVITDTVYTYFGMRKISTHNGRILLNNRPYYQRLALVQGYWSDTLLTPPSDEAIEQDVLSAKKLGFNGVRMHQKIEDPRFYYYADKLGLLIWGEMPSAYEFNADTIGLTINEWSEAIKRDFNHPSIVVWAPFNESWGLRNIATDIHQQQYARAVYHLTKSLDSTRLVSTNDGWEQLEDSDICGIHDYFSEPEMMDGLYNDIETLCKGDVQGRLIYCIGQEYQGQPVMLTEFGGFAYRKNGTDGWGYKKAADDETEFIERFKRLLQAVQKQKSLQGFCYTQLYDVMQEINGLLSAGRKPKADIELIEKIVNGSLPANLR